MDQDRRSIWYYASNGLYFLVLFGAFLAYAASSRDQPAFFLAVICIMVGSFLCTLVHECGHALAALTRGWHVILFVVPPFGIQVPNRDLAMVSRGYSDDLDGRVVSVPATPAADTSANWAIVLAAGATANFVLGGFALLAWAGLLRPFGGGLLVSQVALGLGMQSLLAGIFSLLPDSGPDGSTDGDKLRALRRNPDAHEANSAVTWLVTLLRTKVRLSDLPRWLLDEAAALSSRSEPIAKYMATVEIGRVLDSLPVDSARARVMIDDYRARHGTDGWVAACDAYLAAIWERDPERATRALSEVPASPAPWDLSLAAQAAVAASRGETVLARARLQEMIATVERASPFKDLTYRDIRRQIEGALI